MVHQQSTVIETDTIRKEQPWMREENLPQRKLKERASKDSPVWAKCIEMLVNQHFGHWWTVDCQIRHQKGLLLPSLLCRGPGKSSHVGDEFLLAACFCKIGKAW